MKMYVKPSVNVIELQLKENIAAVPTTVYKGTSRDNALDNVAKVNLVLSTEGSGITKENYAFS